VETRRSCFIAAVLVDCRAKCAASGYTVTYRVQIGKQSRAQGWKRARKQRPSPFRLRSFPRGSGKPVSRRFSCRSTASLHFDESSREWNARSDPQTRLTSARGTLCDTSAHARARIARDNRDFPHTRLPLYLRERGACTRGAPLCSPLRYI